MNQDLFVSDRGFLCGYFSINSNQLTSQQLNGWERLNVQSEAQSVQKYQHFYYPGILNLQFCKRQSYRKMIDQQVIIHLSDGTEVAVNILDVRLYLYPYDVLIYAIHIEIPKNTITNTLQVLSWLRNLNVLEQEGCHEFYNVVIPSIQNVYDICARKARNTDGLAHLVENGNKLKLFHATCAMSQLNQPESDNVLFSIGTLFYNDVASENASSPYYIQHELDEHRISVFNNWTGLALLDTFSILHGTNIPSWLLNNWENDYFELLYLYQLYYKVYLYRLGEQYRLQERDVESMQEEIDDFDRQFTYPSVSYNFLPNLLNEAMKKGLNVEEEKQQVSHIISLAFSARQEEREHKSNRFLTFLTIMASFSAIWDICSFLDAILCYDEVFQNTTFGYRIMGSLLMLAICIMAILNNKRK